MLCCQDIIHANNWTYMYLSNFSQFWITSCPCLTPESVEDATFYNYEGSQEYSDKPPQPVNAGRRIIS